MFVLSKVQKIKENLEKLSEVARFSTVAKLLFCITPPSGCLCVMLEWKKKNERNEIVYFYRTHSDILLYGTARFSRGNNKLTFQPQKWKKIKNSQPQTKFTGSYKKKSVYIFIEIPDDAQIDAELYPLSNFLNQLLFIIWL